MSDATQRVKGKREGGQELDRHFDRDRQRREGSREDLALQMPAEERGDQIGAKVEIESTREDGAGDTVERAAVPLDLRSVDG